MMAIEFTSLLKSLKTHSPVGVELPRDVDTNAIEEEEISRWAGDAAQAINNARGRTTVKESDITGVADQQDYDLPEDCRSVVGIRRDDTKGRRFLDIPIAGRLLGGGISGSLPSGQEVSPSLDLIDRQRTQLTRRDNDWELFEGQIRFLFRVVNDERIVVRYRAVDRSLDSIPVDYYELVLTYLKFKNLKSYLERNGISIVQDGDRMGTESVAGYTRMMYDLQREWTAGVNSIGQESS